MTKKRYKVQLQNGGKQIDKFGIMVNWDKKDQLANCVYFVLIEFEFLISEIDQSCAIELDNNIGILVRYFGIGELSGYFGFVLMANWGLLLCSELIAKDHGYEIGFQYDIVK